MVKVKEDLTGLVFGRLTVLRQVEDYIIASGKHYAQWLCECSCKAHNQVIVSAANLKSGHSTSCGCIVKELAAKRFVGNTYGQKNRKGNANDLSGEFGVLWSSNTNEEVYFDLEYASKILEHTWWIAKNGYPTATIENKNIPMHIFLEFKWHDHQNQNKLDNRSSNLRPCTKQENQRNCGIGKNNTSGFTGVTWSKNRQKWVAQIMVDYKTINLGRFTNKEDAVRARLQAEVKYFKDFSPQRHLFEQYGIECNPENNTKGGDTNE